MLLMHENRFEWNLDAGGALESLAGFDYLGAYAFKVRTFGEAIG